jgi:hypothetical protein
MKDPLPIVKWIRTGELPERDLPKTVGELLHAAGRILDKANVSDLLGDCVFKTADGFVQVGSIEFEVRHINPLYLEDLLEEDGLLEHPEGDDT